jgi:hypothetical protein
MKEFDLELAKAGHPVCTRDGKPARIICFDVKGTDYPIVAAIMAGDVEYINQYPNSGKYCADSHASPGDLMMVSEVEESDIKEAIKYAIAASTHEDGILLNGVTESEAIAWLEEQGEVDNLHNYLYGERNVFYKVGDWIIRSTEGFKHNIYLVTEVKDYYVCEDLKGRRVTFTFNDVHKNFRLWNISDAKNGDVLADGYNNIGLYNKEVKGNFWNSYIYLGCDNRLYGFGGYHDLKNTNKNTKPATKEQRDLLFQKIKEAGYEWNAEKKELKKIEQNPSWSEEDENRFNNLKWLVEHSDEGNRTKEGFIKFIDRLKKRWKPSEEQIQALEYQVHTTYEGSWQYRASKELLEQLKKL